MSDPALESIYNYRMVEDGLRTSGQPSEAQLRAIAHAGFETVINLALHDDPRYSLPDEPGLVRSLGLTYVHIPVQFSAPTETQLLAFFAAIEAHRECRVWVHCAANFRVSAFLGLYHAIRHGKDPDAAFARLHELWQPDEVWSSFIAAMLAKYRA